MNPKVTAQAAIEGNLELIKWMHNNYPTDGNWYSKMITCKAAQYGHKEIVEYSYRSGEYPFRKIGSYAALGGQLELLKWMSSDPRWSTWVTVHPSAFAYAAKGGHLEVLEWLYRSNKYKASSKATNYAAAAGHLEVLKWLKINGLIWDIEFVIPAVENGRLNILQWFLEEENFLKEKDYISGNEEFCIDAAKNGQLETLQWLRLQGCPWSETVSNFAALNGHLEVLQWAKENGCPWDERTCHNAYFGGHYNIVRWALDNGCPVEGNYKEYIGEGLNVPLP